MRRAKQASRAAFPAGPPTGSITGLALAADDEHPSRRRARDRCIAGAVRESVQLEVGVEGSSAASRAKHQPRPSDPVLAHLRADDREQAAPHTNRAPRAEHGSNGQGLPRRADAILKAGVRRLDTGRALGHASSRATGPAFTSGRASGRTGRWLCFARQAGEFDRVALGFVSLVAPVAAAILLESSAVNRHEHCRSVLRSAPLSAAT